MKVSELIEELMLLPKDREVWISSDPEGNYFRPVSEAQIMSTHDDDDDQCYYEPWDEMKHPPENVIVIWPGYPRS